MLAGAANAVPTARRFVRSWLHAHRLDVVAPRLELVVSELFTNAVVHGRGPIQARLSVERDCVRVEIIDHGGGQPRLRPPTEPGGWGLRLVDQLADAWGSDVGDGRTLVWAEHGLPPNHRSGTSRRSDAERPGVDAAGGLGGR